MLYRMYPGSIFFMLLYQLRRVQGIGKGNGKEQERFMHKNTKMQFYA